MKWFSGGSYMIRFVFFGDNVKDDQKRERLEEVDQVRGYLNYLGDK